MSAPRLRRLLPIVVIAVGIAAAYGAAKAWRKYEHQRGEQRIAAVARPGDIVMLSSTTCSDCVVARHALEALRVPFDECFIETDAACAERFRALRGIGTPTFVVRGEKVTGYDRRLIAKALDAPR
jgi:glutaredoxin